MRHGCYHLGYKRWERMMARCYNKNEHNYANYGGRGITVCKDWKNAGSFCVWFDETYIDGLSIDRIDNEKGYSPDNCRWADNITQGRNKRKLSSNTTGFIGVDYFKLGGKFRARIRVNRSRRFLGYFDTAIEAAKTRDKHIIENRLENFVLNFPKSQIQKWFDAAPEE